ncbi:HlyD family secretion protein [Acetobacteraceae bacterium]|nr:HlyD family secretion protein [Acetobacteraceae bacterium]
MSRFSTIIRPLLTSMVIILALGLGYIVWDVYVLNPWTRDGRVRVYVVISAPEVEGTVTSIPVVDNQFVHRGDPIYVLDKLRFQLDVQHAKARVSGAQDEYELAVRNAHRRLGLGGAVSREEEEDYDSETVVKRAFLNEAKAELNTALVNLQRSTVYASVDGYITDLNLRVGDYVHIGQPVMSIVDSSTFWIYAYMEETKIHGVHIGDVARIKLMGYRELLKGHVVSIGRGINDKNGEWDRLGLPTVDPIFTWVRLAQRIPVRIEFDEIPPNVILVSGMTGSVAIGPKPPGGRGNLIMWLQNHL